MTERLLPLLGLVNLALAMGVFLLLARPELLLGGLARVRGLGGALDRGELSEAAEDSLLGELEEAGKPAVIGLFAWSLVSGALAALSRL